MNAGQVYALYYVTCPACGQRSLPSVTGTEDAVACQNLACRAVLDRDGRQLGIWELQDGRVVVRAREEEYVEASD